MAAGCRSRGVCLAYVWPRDGWPLTPRGRRCGLDLAGSCHGRLQVLRVWVIWPGMEKRKARPGATAAWLTTAWLAAAWLAAPWRPAAAVLWAGRRRTHANNPAMPADDARMKRLWTLSGEDCAVSSGDMRNQHQSVLGKTIRTILECSESLLRRVSSS